MYEINKSRIGLKIKDVRESNGCSMAEFGDKLGVTKGAVNNYEKGRVVPRTFVLKKIISLSSNPEQTINEFIYESLEVYLKELFSELDQSEQIIDHGFISDLKDFINEKHIFLGDRAKIFKQASFIKPSLLHNESFMELWESYLIQENSSDVLEDGLFLNTLVPALERDFTSLPYEDKVDVIMRVRQLLLDAHITSRRNND